MRDESSFSRRLFRLVERVIDSNRLYYKMPSEESAMMAWMAQSKLNRHVERRMIGLS